MIELRWVYKNVQGSPNTRTKVLEFMRTYEVVDNIIERHNDGSCTTSGKRIQEIEKPEWVEVPLCVEPGTFIIQNL